MTKAHILSEIKRTAEANGGIPLGSRKFASETGIRDPDWKGKLWARWNDAVREAGFTPNELQEAYDETVLLSEFAKLAKSLRRLPTNSDMRLSVNNGMRLPEYGTYVKRFGGKAQLVEKLLEFCRKHDEFAQVVQLCEGYLPREREEQGESLEGEIGFGYLIKSGRFFKVGRSNAAGRREYELSIQLPEKATTTHVIRTDDPCGIEAYWHKRFESKRKNGEWFELDAGDIAAFKRRKFM